MPYGQLARQRLQRFASYEDLDRHECTIEEREEYEPHLKQGTIVYAGVDYAAILAEAEKEADVILWDGGNNDFAFFEPDLTITVVDPHRPGHELAYHPGEINFRLADVIVINKMDSAPPEGRGHRAREHPPGESAGARGRGRLADHRSTSRRRSPASGCWSSRMGRP